MAEISLVFIPIPVVSHLTPAIEMAKILLSRDPRLSITCLIIRSTKFDPLISPLTSSIISDRFQFLDIPNLDSESPAPAGTPLLIYIESKKPAVKKIISHLIESQSGPRVAGVVLDMFCTYFIELSARLLPSMAFDKEQGMSAEFVRKAREFRKTKGILVNSFIELESHAVESMKLDQSIPPVYSVGPVLNMGSKGSIIRQDQETEIMKWLDTHPPASVVFLCFGSMGAFGPDQVKEIARGLESSGCRFLWALRRPSSSQVKYALPEEYEDFSEVLPEGFLERTAGFGKVIGWAPQIAVLGHPSMGGFVSHCGWSSILEALWFGVPIATWPMYSEQQINAFEATKEIGIGVEISLDYRIEIGKSNSEGDDIVGGEQIETGIRQVMKEDSEVRKKVKLMMEKSREAVVEGGSSYNLIGQFLTDIRKNIGL